MKWTAEIRGYEWKNSSVDKESERKIKKLKLWKIGEIEGKKLVW